MVEHIQTITGIPVGVRTMPNKQKTFQLLKC